MTVNPLNGVTRKGILFCLVGPSGGGKTTFGARLCQEFAGTLRLSISATSRSPRPGEEEGKSYYFMSREAFKEKIDRGEFFEWEETHGNYYGTLRTVVEEAVAGGIDLLLDVDIRGAFNFKKHFPGETVIIFLVPPSFAVLQERVEKRAKLSEKELATRFKTAEREYKQLLESMPSSPVDYFLVNNELDTSYDAIRSTLVAERNRINRFVPEFVQSLCTITT